MKYSGRLYLIAVVLLLTSSCDTYEAPITAADEVAPAETDDRFDVPAPLAFSKEFNDYNGSNGVIGDYQVTLKILPGTLFGDKIDVFEWSVRYVGEDPKNDKINHFAITLDECAVNGFFSQDPGFNRPSSTTFDVQWHPSEGQEGPYVFTGQYPAGQGRWIGYGPAEIKTSSNAKFTGMILLPCMNTTTLEATVFFDDDRDGSQAAEGEDGIDGITVRLLDADNLGDPPGDPDDELVAVKTSTGGGTLTFEGVFTPGKYSFELPSAVTDLWLSTTLPGETDVSVNATPVVGLDKFDILGNVYTVDTDGQNRAGRPGLNVEVWHGSTKIADAVTDADGNYVLVNLFGNPSPYAAYQVRIPKASNTAFYDAFVPLPDEETLADGSAVINGVRVGGTSDSGCGAGNSCGNDIGFEPRVYSISGRVTVDPRNSDTGSGDEIGVAGIPNVTVELIPQDAGGSCGPTCAAVTGGFGQYSFSDVPPGSYIVSVSDVTAESDFNEDLNTFYRFTGIDARPNDGGAQLAVSLGPDATHVDFSWLALTDVYTNAFRNDPNFVIFSLGVTEWLHKFQAACRANDDANHQIQYKDRFKQVQYVSAQSLIDQLNTFLYTTVPPEPFASSCGVADALSQPLATDRNNVDALTKLYWQLLAAELNFFTEHLGLVISPLGIEDGALPENMLRYMEDFLDRELFGAQSLSKQTSSYDSEANMLSAYNGGGGGGGGGGFE